MINIGPGWFRILGYGLAFLGPDHPRLFSERNGYTTVIKLGFGWRAKALTPR